MRKSTNKSELIKRIVDLDVELATNRNLTPQERRNIRNRRDSLEHRLYNSSQRV